MSGAPPVGAFPQTPMAASKRGPARAAPSSSSSSSSDRPSAKSTSPLPVAPQRGASSATSSEPVIPLTILDAPTQRLYAVGVYVALAAWKFYDWAQVVEENTESFWLFLKWIAIDCAFLFGLPELRIPWLELSQPFVVAAFFVHAIFDWMLMFNVGVRSCSPASGSLSPESAASLTLVAVPLAVVDPRTRQGLLRPRARHLGAQCQVVQYPSQFLPDHGPANHQYPPRGVSNAHFPERLLSGLRADRRVQFCRAQP